MADHLTVGQLWRRHGVTRADLDRAVAEHLDKGTARLLIGRDYAVDVDRAIAARPLTYAVFADPRASHSVRATALLNALVLAPAEPG